jgi:ABC-type polysaccharide/polyol phosphate export permease
VLFYAAGPAPPARVGSPGGGDAASPPSSVDSFPGVLPPPRSRIVADVREIVGDVWHFRDLLVQLTLRDVRIRYKQAVMGFGWSILMPALVVLSGILVRMAMSHVATGVGDAGVPSIGGIVIKSLPWAFFVASIGFAVNALTGNVQLVSKVYFPREVLPLAVTVAQCVDLVVGIVVLTIALPFLGATLSWALLWVPVLLVLLVAITSAAGLFLSCANLFYRDVKYIVQVMLTFGIFFTPVFFEPAAFGRRGPLLMLNPRAPGLEGCRLSVIEGHSLWTSLVVNGALAWSPWYLLYSVLWGTVGLLASAIIFHRAAYAFAENV